MNCLQLMYILGLCSCFCWAKEREEEYHGEDLSKHVLPYTRSMVRSSHAFDKYSRDIIVRYSMQIVMSDSLDKSLNVTSSATCLLSQKVFINRRDEYVQFNATKTAYNVGDNVTLKCYVSSGWLTVSFGRNYSDLGYCFTTMNRCYPSVDIRDKYGNYEFKLEKSLPMLVIKNVTKDQDGVDFTCHWTSYTDTTSFAVTDKAVTTRSTPEENRSDISTVLVSVLVPVVVVVIVLVIVAIVIVRKHVLYRCIGDVCINWFGRRKHEHAPAPINTYTGNTCVTGQELHTFSDNIGENISSLSPNGDVNCDHQKQRDRHMEDIHGPNVHGTECVTPFLENKDR